jgi:hypothetical protein
MSEKFEHWGIVELMGHQRASGRLTEEVIGGANLLRVDVPTDAHNFRTVYYGASAIYALHITDEEAARKMASQSGARPPFAYEIEGSRLPAIASNGDRGLPDDEEYGA